MAGQIRHAIADFLAHIAAQAIRPTLDLLGRTVLATPNLTENSRVKEIWTGSLVVTNAVFVLLVIVGGFVVMTRETLQAHTGLKEIAPRLGVAALTSNLSLVIIGKAIGLANALTGAVAHRGVNPKKAAAAIEQAIQAELAGDSVMASVLVIAVVVMAIVVVAVFVLRIMLMVGLIGVAPLALACHALPQTEQIAYTWWRSLAACLVIQVVQAVVLVAALRVFLTPTKGVLPGYQHSGDGLLGVLVCAVTLWVMVKIPFWTRHYVLAGLQTPGRGIVGRVLSIVFIAKALGRRGTSKVHTRSGTPAVVPPAADPPVRRSPRPAGDRTSARPVSSRVRRPVGPVAFSHAPVHQTPLPRRVGSNTAPRFSHPPATAAPRTASSGPAPVGFSHPPERQVSPTPTRPVSPVVFTSPAPPSPAVSEPVARAGTAGPVLFSHAAPPQVAPKRPPAPVTPTFSHAQVPPRRGRGGSASKGGDR